MDISKIPFEQGVKGNSGTISQNLAPSRKNFLCDLGSPNYGEPNSAPRGTVSLPFF